jgi:hypothetical protein
MNEHDLDELERALSRPPGAAPAGFVDRVMARVAVTRQERGRVPLAEVLPLFPTIPWWARAAFDPAAVLATLLVAMLLWRGDALLALVASGAAYLVAWQAQVSPAVVPAANAATAASVWLQPMVLTCLTLAAVPLALMSSRLLYHWSAHLMGPRRLRTHGR